MEGGDEVLAVEAHGGRQWMLESDDTGPEERALGREGFPGPLLPG